MTIEVVVAASGLPSPGLPGFSLARSGQACPASA
ncbi:hypothetical protein BKA14_004197 [Actinoplanes abujensis]|uniref:Uncharacterized protein n=1 Tax=Paractinoplanes abujensis TaxID=882441 RepID=A0A7W7CSV8_9ACTN|nr:hypothetical protein [Actinoplanes abujensis]